jgi:hypothetical protein
VTDGANAHPSDSAAQRSAESLIIAAVAETVGVPLQPTVLTIGDARVQIDGASANHRVLVEAYARVGPLRGAQPRKLAADAFKLAWVGPRVGAERLVLAVMDTAAEDYANRPRAWLTAALRDGGIEVIRVEVDAITRAAVESAQRTQFR